MFPKQSNVCKNNKFSDKMTSKFRNLIGANLISVLKHTAEAEPVNNSARRLAAGLKLNYNNPRKVAFNTKKNYDGLFPFSKW